VLVSLGFFLGVNLRILGGVEKAYLVSAAQLAE